MQTFPTLERVRLYYVHCTTYILHSSHSLSGRPSRKWWKWGVPPSPPPPLPPTSVCFERKAMFAFCPSLPHFGSRFFPSSSLPSLYEHKWKKGKYIWWLPLFYSLSFQQDKFRSNKMGPLGQTWFRERRKGEGRGGREANLRDNKLQLCYLETFFSSSSSLLPKMPLA